MSTISAALDVITAIQEGLTIDTPENFDVTKVYRYFLDPQYELPGPRVFMNEWHFLPIDPKRMMSLREIEYAVRMQFIAAEVVADGSRTVLIAESFWESLLAAMCQNVSLDGTATRALLRGGEPTIGLITRGGKSYIGFECFLDVQMRSSFLWR